MEDGVFLVKRTALDIKDRSVRVMVDFGNTGEDLSNAVFMANGDKLFISPRELAKRLVHFSFIEQSSGDAALLAGMYLFFGWLLPVGYVVIQEKSLDLRRFLQFVWEDRPGKVIILLLLVVIVALNFFIYSEIYDINSFKEDTWRNPKRHTNDFNRVIERVEEEQPVYKLFKLIADHQKVISSFLQEEITEPLRLMQTISTENNTTSKKVIGISFFDQTGERKAFRLTPKEIENLYIYSYRISTMCLEANDSISIEEQDYLSSKGITAERKSIAWHKQVMEEWKTKNKIAEITNEITLVADCDNKTMFWLFGKKYYVAYPIKKFTDMFNKKTEN